METMKVYSVPELKQILGNRYLSKIIAESGDTSYVTIRYVLTGECEDIDIIKKVMNAIDAAVAQRNRVNAINAQLKGQPIPTQNAA